MIGASAGDLLDFVAQMDDFELVPNLASFNLILKAMRQAKETEAAEKLLERLVGCSSGKESLPNDESYDLVMGMLFEMRRVEAALKYIDMALQSGFKLSIKVFTECIACCVSQGQLDTLVTLIERCRLDDLLVAKCCFEYGGENARPPFLLSVDEGLIVSALATAGRTYSSNLLDASWAILRCSLCQKKVPSPESFLGKIYAHASLGNLQKAFGTLHEFEAAHGNLVNEAEGLFSPFTSLYPLVVACSKKGFEALDSYVLLYFQLFAF
ncbi:Tetratricopeptide repeat (TPR)-like superfamily protein isoform 1 [Gossypium australe]|uniref:Tetratricopeptide repeat (TPR)-like superfamily protein isoform 1 n=1 Tax=Gossypium australe TaxID=47621 RepID=A0A5B6URW5_9ROSI|nr:Tetratricopeptide repeat (TPR)-like superfamily protein isoform 1 [Gossypium australe]